MTPLSAPYAHERGGGLHDAVPGCLINTQNRVRVCGPVLMDTGAPWLSVANPPQGSEPWPDGAPAALELFDTVGALVVREAMTTGLRDLGTRLTWRREAHVYGPVIYAGVAPYFAFSVLYDPRHQTIGLKPRAPGPDPASPRAVAVELAR